TATGQLDDTGGQGGKLTYFSPGGQYINTGLQFHNPINSSGQDDGFVWADWDQVGHDANAHDPFGPGGPGAGEPGTLSATALKVMDVLGWTLPGPTDTYSNSPSPATINENSGTFTFTVTRSDASQAATVFVSTVQDQGFTNNNNYTNILDQQL